jgi:hypothetical protein
MVSVFLGQDSGFFNRFEDFRNLVSRDSVLVFRTWMVSDFQVSDLGVHLISFSVGFRCFGFLGIGFFRIRLFLFFSAFVLDIFFRFDNTKMHMKPSFL